VPGRVASYGDTVAKPFIREVILENFMSHEYSRVEFRRGLNVIIGPNGAGKSSILLAISVALGQTYTERGHRLSDLIRRGEEAARVAVVFDNTAVNGKRPIPQYNTDTLTITRFIKRNGDYWHYINNRYKAKAEVEYFLSQIGINPNNMLIIMHQNMIENFLTRNSIEKLLMVEEAVGAQRLRERIKDAEKKLESLSAEEKILQKTLDEARSAVEFWREEYEKLILLKKLTQRKEELEKEYAWSLVNEAQKSKERVLDKIRSLEDEVGRVVKDAEQRDVRINTLADELITIYGDTLDGKQHVSREEFRNRLENLINDAYEAGSLRERINNIKRELRSLYHNLTQLEKELSERINNALQKGEQVSTDRKYSEIMEDIKTVTLQIAALGKVNHEAEDFYLLAESKYRETELKAQQVSENTRKALEELEYRREKWRSFLRDLINDIQPQYDNILRKVGGTGYIELRNLDDLEKAALELYAGFRGVEPSLLNGHSQSGGERIVATMAFLLALQKHMRSPFRAIDEFDVHLDPLNRERIINILTSTAQEDPSAQYIIITPGKIPFHENMNIIVVQNISGRSAVRVEQGREVEASAKQES